MNGQPTGGRSARARAAAIVTCAVIAVLGGMITAAPADAATINGCEPLQDLLGTGAMDIGPSSDPIDLLLCPTDPSTSGGSTTATETTSAPSATDAEPSSTPVSTTSGDAETPLSAGATMPARLSELMVNRSSNTVYPVKDGYQDSVRFAINAINTAGQGVPVQGSAVLSQRGHQVRTWLLDGSTSIISWNGRVGKRIEPGLYALTVTALSADGTSASSSTYVRVLPQHLERRAVVVRTNVGARSVTASLPRQLLKAYAKGLVTVRVRTDATVSAPAQLVFTNDGVTRTIPLRDGVHTTPSLPVPLGFDHVQIAHHWAKGVAHLRSLKAIWSYYTLV